MVLKLKYIKYSYVFYFFFILQFRLLGESDYLSVLLGMQKNSPKPNGHIYFSDPRLTDNGFLIKIIPGMWYSEF